MSVGMAQTEIQFVTRAEFRAFQVKQDSSIKDLHGEFGKQATLFDTANQQLRHELNTTINHGLSSLHTAFDDKLANVNGTLSGRLGELNNELGLVKADIRALKTEVGQVKTEVGQVKTEVGQVKTEVGQVKTEVMAKIGQVEAEVMAKVMEVQSWLHSFNGRLSNSSRSKPWETLTIIGAPNPANEFTLPDYFPRTIDEFWKLQFPGRRETLIYLLRFYDIQGFQLWDRALPDYATNDAVDSANRSSDGVDDPPQQLLSLEDAVDKYPDLALDDLAKAFGLSMGDIRSFYEKSKQMQHKEKSLPPKRPSDTNANSEMEVVKRLRNQTSRTSPDLFLHASPQASPSSSPKSRIVWDAESNKRAMDEMLAKHGNKPRSIESLLESTTDAFESQDSQKPGDGKKKRSNKS